MAAEIPDKIAGIKATLKDLNSKIADHDYPDFPCQPSYESTEPLANFLEGRYTESMQNKSDMGPITVSDYVLFGEQKDSMSSNATPINQNSALFSKNCKNYEFSTTSNFKAETEKELRRALQQKEDLIVEMTKVQNDLYQNLADYKHQVTQLKFESDKREKEIQIILQEKDNEIAKLKHRGRKQSRDLKSRSKNRDKSGNDENSFIINETMSLLGVKALQDISPAIKNKDRTCKKLNRYEQFSEKVQMLIQQVSPPDKFDGQKPGLKATWNWVTRLFEQYMKLKKSSSQERQVRKVFKQLMKALGMTYPQDVELLKEKLNKLSK